MEDHPEELERPTSVVFLSALARAYPPNNTTRK